MFSFSRTCLTKPVTCTCSHLCLFFFPPSVSGYFSLPFLLFCHYLSANFSINSLLSTCALCASVSCNLGPTSGWRAHYIDKRGIFDNSCSHDSIRGRAVATRQANQPIAYGPELAWSPQTPTGFELNATTNCVCPFKFCDSQWKVQRHYWNLP